MIGASFELDWSTLPLVCALAGLFYFLFTFKRFFLPPQIFIAALSLFDLKLYSWREKAAFLPRYLAFAALLLWSLALLNPRFYTEKKHAPLPNDNNLAIEGLAIYLALDQSGSMKEEINAAGFTKRIPKVDLLREVTKAFILGDPKAGLPGRANDLIGLVTFARGAEVLSPLTLDHQAIIQELNRFDVVKDRDQDGTSIGYAIFKTANLLAATRNFAHNQNQKGKPAYEIKSSVILLVTDGLQDPNPLDNGKRWRQIDPLDAARYAKENNIRLYIVNVEPKLAVEEFAANRRQMSKAAELTGGKFFMVDNSANLAAIYADIDRLEKSDLPIDQTLKQDLQKILSKDQLPEMYDRLSLYPFLIALGLACLTLMIVLETTVLRRVP